MKTWLKVPARHRCNYCGKDWPKGTVMLKLTFPRAKASSYRGPCCSADWGAAPPDDALMGEVPGLPVDIGERHASEDFANRKTKPMVGLGVLARQWR